MKDVILNLRLQRYSIMTTISIGGIAAFVALDKLYTADISNRQVYKAFVIAGLCAFSLILLFVFIALAGEEEQTDRSRSTLKYLDWVFLILVACGVGALATCAIMPEGWHWWLIVPVLIAVIGSVLIIDVLRKGLIKALIKKIGVLIGGGR